MTLVSNREDFVIYRDPAAYTSHPCVARLSDGQYLVAFCETLARRRHLHPPADPRFVNLVARSQNGGRAWEPPRVAPGYEWTGMQCPGITQISTGDVLLSQWQFRWLPLEAARARVKHGDPQQYLIRDPETRRWRVPQSDSDWTTASHPWARYDGGCFVQRSRDGGATWDYGVQVTTHPHPRGYSPRPVIEMADGTLILALGSEEDDTSRAGLTAAFVVRSLDRGQTWGPPITAIPRTPGRWVNEPTVLAMPDGRLILMAREAQYYLISTESSDGGLTWTPPVQTPIWGYPAHLILLRDGRVMCVYGHRRPPFGIRACLSADGGRTWNYDDELVIRDDLRNGNSGYPTAAQDPDGSVLVAYYTEDGEGVTHIVGSRFTL